jgi:hypothetical protein
VNRQLTGIIIMKTYRWDNLIRRLSVRWFKGCIYVFPHLACDREPGCWGYPGCVWISIGWLRWTIQISLYTGARKMPLPPLPSPEIKDGGTKSTESDCSGLPRVNIRCECSDGIVHGSTSLNVVRVEQEDDGTFTAVTDHWPNGQVDRRGFLCTSGRLVSAPQQKETTMDTAEWIVKVIEDDFTDRRGLRQEWEQIDAEIQAEIRATWTALIRKELAKEHLATLMHNNQQREKWS